MSDEHGLDGDFRFLRRLLLAVLVLGLVLLFWQLRHILVMVFAAVLMAVILRSAVHALHRWLRLPELAALALTVITAILLLAGALYLFGAEIARQAEAITEALPAALDRVREFAEEFGFGGWLEQQVERVSGELADGGRLGGFLFSAGDALANIVIVAVGAVFLAARPQLYRTGFLKLVPPWKRKVAGEALDDCETALRLWFKGRLMAMLGVGLLTGIGLWLIGVPSFLALGLLATLMEIVPFFGPILAAIPGILLALLESPTLALLAVGLYLLVQQAEGNLISPLIQQHAVELPPAVLLFSLLVFGLLFGLIGILLAEPLTVTVFVLVKKLYVREALGTPTPIPGEKD